MMANTPADNRAELWRKIAAGLICAAGVALGGWTLSLVAGGVKLSPATPGFLGLAAGALLLLGVLFWMRVVDAALVAVVFLDAGALAAVLTPLGLGRVKLSLSVPLGIGLAALVGVAFSARRKMRGRPCGFYNFITRPSGAIRVARPNINPSFSTHVGLSGGGEVRFAGSIRFTHNHAANRGTIVRWSNNSGHYRPPASLSGQAGLPSSSFVPH